MYRTRKKGSAFLIKTEFKNKFYNEDLDLINDKTERFVIFTNDFKQMMGGWYSILAIRILPLIIFFVPVNVVLGRISRFVNMHYLPDYRWDGPILLIIWLAMMVILLLLSVFAPKAASVYEFLFGFSYLFLVFRYHLFNTVFGIVLMISMILFLLVKSYFLAVKIIGKIKFAGDEKGVERDESGRIVRATEDDVFFVGGKERDIIEKNRPVSSADDDFLFEKTAESKGEIPKAKIDSDNDFFFGGNDKAQDNKMPIASTDDDFFFG